MIASSWNDGLSADHVIAALDALYDPSLWGDSVPSVYSVEVTESNQARLRPGASLRMVYLPDVQRALEGVARPPGSGATTDPESVALDAFVFFDAMTGEHLVTQYVGSDE